MTDVVGNLHPEFRSFWHPVAWSDEVVRSALFPTTLLGEPLVIARDEFGAPVAFADACPHRGAPISMGRSEGDEFVCAFHGWRFGLDGVATCIPSLGPAAPLPSRARLTPVAVCEVHGLVWVALEAPRAEIPAWSDGANPAYGVLRPLAHTSEALATYQTENLLDASHFPFLHGALAGRNPEMAEIETVDQQQLGFATRLRKLTDDGEGVEGWLRYTCAAPFTVMLRSEEPDGRMRTSFFQAIQPIDERRTRMFFMIRVPYTEDAQLAATLPIEQQILNEDHVMNSALRRAGMHLSGGPDLHVRSDRNGVLYRRMLRNVFDTSAPSGPVGSER